MHSIFLNLPVFRPGLLAVACLLACGTSGAATPAATDDFSPLVELAPFAVNGRQLAVSVHARSGSDRRYAEKFAEEVLKVVDEAVTPETGRGLVIIGAKGEPHPIFVFRRFLALAQEGKLDPALAARGPELTDMLHHWQDSVDDGKGGGPAENVDMEFEKIVTALPLPLTGVGAKLYQLAWAEKFDQARVEARLRALQPGDLERRDLFARFDWVFYLPPKNAFDRVLDEIVADAMKEEDAGFFARVAVKGALLVVKPKIRRAIEGLRHGVLFSTIVQARTKFDREDVSALTDAYLEALVPDDEGPPVKGTDHERAVKAVREELKQLADKPKEPAADKEDGAQPGTAG